MLAGELKKVRPRTLGRVRRGPIPGPPILADKTAAHPEKRHRQPRHRLPVAKPARPAGGTEHAQSAGRKRRAQRRAETDDGVACRLGAMVGLAVFVISQ